MHLYRIRQKPFFFLLKKVKKKLLNIFSNFYFYLEVQSFGLVMENNFIQMDASAGQAVVYTIGPIFKDSSCISPMASRILSFQASIVSGLLE